MKKLISLACVLSLSLLIAPPMLAADAKKPEPPKGAAAPASALDAARDYTSMLKAGKGSAAAEKYWDTDGMIHTIFGDALKQQTPDEVKEVKELWTGFLTKMFANPDTQAAMKQANFSDFKATEEGADNGTLVSYQMKLGEKAVPNSVRLKRESAAWKITDLATNGQLFVDTLQKAYAPQSKKVTPLNFMKMMSGGLAGARKPPAK